MLSESDLAAVMALVVRGVKAHDDSAAAMKAFEEAQVRMKDASDRIARFNQALLLFDIDIKAGGWDLVGEQMGKENFNRAIRIARGQEPSPASSTSSTQKQASVTEVASIAENDGASAQGASSEADPKSLASASTPEKNTADGEEREPATMRQLVTDTLSASPSLSATASEIRAAIESKGVKMHEKTVGMTLYRMSKDGLVTRTGRLWSLVMDEDAPAGIWS